MPPRQSHPAKGGHDALKDNQAELKDWAEHLMPYPPDDAHAYPQARSGSLAGSLHRANPGGERFCLSWSATDRANPSPQDAQTHRCNLGRDSPGHHQPKPCSRATLACISRNHWAIENKLHHKRDTVFAEDACRTRKAAQALAALRNLLLGFLHQLNRPVLRSVRSFSVQPMPLFRWLNGCI